VTITGANLSGASAVKFGSVAAASFAVTSPTQITATSPAGSAGTVDLTVTTAGGTSATSTADQFSYAATVASAGKTFTGSAPETVSGVLASFTAPSPSDPASQFQATIQWGDGSPDSAGTITPSGAGAFTISANHSYTTAGSFTITIKITDAADPADNASASDQVSVGSPTPPSTNPVTPQPQSSTSVTFTATVNPNGVPTSANFEYGLDPRYSPAGGPIVYDQSTPTQFVGSDFTVHTVTATVTGLLPNALYDARLVTHTPAGTFTAANQTVMTKKDGPPLPPQLGQSFDAGPVSGIVLIKLPPGAHITAVSTNALTKGAGAGYVPLTEALRLPLGTQVDARAGTLSLTTATGHTGKTQTGVFGGAVFGLSQDRRGLTKGLTTLSLLENAFRGAPSFSSCSAHAAGDQPLAHAAGLSSLILQTLNARDNHGSFRTRGRHAAATVRGTVWTMQERCDGTLTIVHRGTVVVSDFTLRKTITLHAGQRYLARAPLPKPPHPKHK
jgi:hypothetical protein